MIVSIHQPAYLPWLGYFHKIATADVFVIFDMTQFEKNSFINRNKIKTSQGPTWLTVPVITKGLFKKNILTETQIDNSTLWTKKHWKAIKYNYNKAPFFNRYKDFFEEVYGREWIKLIDLCETITRYIVKQLGIKTEIIRTTAMNNVKGEKTDLILNVCKELGASAYFSGSLGKNYLEEYKFRKENIDVIYQNYMHPTYPQLYGSFEPYLSVIDLMFNCGNESLDIILEEQEKVR